MSMIGDITELIKLLRSFNIGKARTWLASKLGHSPSVGGIVHFYETRASLSPQWWQNQFFEESKKPDSTILMSQSMLPAFENDNQCGSCQVK